MDRLVLVYFPVSGSCAPISCMSYNFLLMTGHFRRLVRATADTDLLSHPQACSYF